MPKPKPSELTLPEAILALAEQFKRYNDAHEPVIVKVAEAESYKASYEREPEGARELHEFLTGKDSAAGVGRTPRASNRRSKKAPRGDGGDDGGGA
jgi:hypothetical protein